MQWHVKTLGRSNLMMIINNQNDLNHIENTAWNKIIKNIKLCTKFFRYYGSENDIKDKNLILNRLIMIIKNK